MAAQPQLSPGPGPLGRPLPRGHIPAKACVSSRTLNSSLSQPRPSRAPFTYSAAYQALGYPPAPLLPRKKRLLWGTPDSNVQGAVSTWQGITNRPTRGSAWKSGWGVWAEDSTRPFSGGHGHSARSGSGSLGVFIHMALGSDLCLFSWMFSLQAGESWNDSRSSENTPFWAFHDLVLLASQAHILPLMYSSPACAVF